MSSTKPGTFGNRIPKGTGYLCPGDAEKKRVIESKLVGLFVERGFREVVTPTVEYFETFAEVVGFRLRDKMYKLLDREGHLLVLRPDITAPIAHLAATELAGEPRPLRLFYVGSVFRAEEPRTGRRQEVYQAGVEVIGLAGSKTDAEVIALAIEALKELGVAGFQVGIGDVEFLEGILGALSLNEDAEEKVKTALTARDFVGLEEVARSPELTLGERNLLLKIPSLHGKHDVLNEALRLAGDDVLRSVAGNLGEVYDILGEKGLADHVHLDLGLVRDLDYYTGVVFEAYVPGLGRPICGGGRYDRLVMKFGKPDPAIGFALGVGELLKSG